MSNKCFFCNTEISSRKKYQSAVPSDNEQGWEWVDGCQRCVRKNYSLEELRYIRTGTGEVAYWKLPKPHKESFSQTGEFKI